MNGNNGQNQIPVETQVEGNIDRRPIQEIFREILDEVKIYESKLIDRSRLLQEQGS